MIRAALIAVLLAGPAMAQDAAFAARAAAAELERAAVELDRAEGARDRVQALTGTIRAYESGLTAMREGLRGASIREIELSRDLAARDAEISQLLGVLQTIGTSAGPQNMVHPAGPVGTARSAMMVAAVTPGLAQRASELRGDVEEVALLRQLQQDSVDRLQKGLRGLQMARTELSQALADRTDLPQRFTADPVRVAILISATETLEGFAGGLSEITENDSPIDLPPIGALKGYLGLPVQGEIVRGAGEADAAGVTRPGIVLGTRERALVTSPTAATIRYLGPLLDYGIVAIVEPEPNLLFVFAGLDQAFGEIGQVIPEGTPLGLMGGEEAAQGDILSQSSERGGTERPETLYIEVRQGDEPVDPLDWFTTDKG